MAGRGAPIGNTNAAKARRWSNAIERAIDAYPDEPVSLSINKGLDKAAVVFVAEMMAKKDATFFKEFGDRIDGKAAQQVNLDGTMDAGAGLLAVLSSMKANK